MDCIFCKIINQEIPAKIDYENEHLFVIDDINPQAPVHKLIIPKAHIATLNDLETPTQQQIMGLMYGAAIKLAQDLKVAEPGYRLVSNCNKDGGQTVFHIHLHLLAGKAFHWPPG